MSARIAVVSDELATRQLVTLPLLERGYDVHTLGLLTDATAFVRNESPDLVIADVELPDGCGLDLLATLREPNCRTAPVIVLCGSRDERTLCRGFAAGAADCMAKPFSRGELMARCSAQLSRHSRLPETAPTAETMRFELGCGRYTVLRELGRGSYGRVFTARDAGASGGLVAVKVLDPPRGEGEDARLRFIRETYALGQIDHPSVIHVFDVGNEQDRLYYTMEYVHGPTLADHVKRSGPLSESEARTLARGLLGALSAVERAGIVHRDVKPANVILRHGDTASPVLIDFGIAKEDNDCLATGPTMLGSPSYMSPEAIRGERSDHRSDLFSLGLLLRYALTGSEVFTGPVHDVMRAICHEPIALPLALLSESFARFLAALVRKERFARPSSAAAALHWLDRLAREAEALVEVASLGLSGEVAL